MEAFPLMETPSIRWRAFHPMESPPSDGTSLHRMEPSPSDGTASIRWNLLHPTEAVPSDGGCSNIRSIDLYYIYYGFVELKPLLYHYKIISIDQCLRLYRNLHIERVLFEGSPRKTEVLVSRLTSN